MSWKHKHKAKKSKRLRVCVRLDQEGGGTSEQYFAEAFRIGREDHCEVQIVSSMVSREHAEVVFENGQWWVRDLKSTNGIYVNGEKVPEAPLEKPLEVQLGRKAPILHLSLETVEAAVQAKAPEEAPPSPRERAATPPMATTRRGLEAQETFQATSSSRPRPDPPWTASRARPEIPDRVPPQEEVVVPPQKEEVVPPQEEVAAVPAEARTSNASALELPPKKALPPGIPPPDPSVSQVIQRYFDVESAGPAGEHTQMIRRAYVEVKKKQDRKYTWIIASVLVLFVLAIGYGAYQYLINKRVLGQASQVFTEMKQQDLEMARLRSVLEETNNAELSQLLQDIQQRRMRQAAAYDGYVKELGIYRKLSPEDRLVYETARIFNESEFGITADFLREVKTMIREHWQGPGKRTLTLAIERAQQRGYTPYIVSTMQKYGLPPEFFYLAVQESVMDTSAVGPATRWGIAKGMWQFIPSTGRRYGLRIGPRESTRMVDVQDDRHNFEKATEASARYLHDIYREVSQASGLLVMASYNWGEHRVAPKLQNLPNSEAVFAEMFADIPDNPNERNYWRFLTQYEDRMPEETKDYVLKIFSAAVIGQNPRHFGFDFDNPLKPYMEMPDPQAD